MAARWLKSWPSRKSVADCSTSPKSPNQRASILGTSEENPATGTVAITLSSRALNTIVCHPPPDRPVTPSRLRSTWG